MNAVSFDLAAGLVSLDGEVLRIDPHNEVVTGSGAEYVVYHAIVPTRTHQSVTAYTDVPYKVPAVVCKETARRLIQVFANLSAHNVTLSTVPPTCGMAETLDRLKDELLATAAAQSASAATTTDADRESVERTLKILCEVVSHVDTASIEAGFVAGNPTRANLDTGRLNLSELVGQVVEFIYAYVTYAPECIALHPLNSSLYILYSMVQLLFMEHSHFQSDIFTPKTDLVLHVFIAMLFDLLTDRASTELFLLGKNKQGEAIMSRYRREFPAWTRVVTRNDVDRLPRAFYDRAAEEPVRLLPFAVAYHMRPKERVTYLYETFAREFNRHLKNGGKLPSGDEMWTFLEGVAKEMDACGLYRGEMLMELLARLLPVVTEL